MLDDRLILRGADGYNEARFARVFNARRPERYPAAVLVTESADDVVEGVRLARDRGWKVAIRAGGHSFPAWSLREDGLVMDLGGLRRALSTRAPASSASHPPLRAANSMPTCLAMAALSPPPTVPPSALVVFCSKAAWAWASVAGVTQPSRSPRLRS